MKTGILTDSTGVYSPAFDGPGQYDNCLIVDCNCQQDGGQPLMRLRTGSMVNCTVVGCAVPSGGIHLRMDAGARIENSILAGNTVAGEPGLAVSTGDFFSHCLSDVTLQGTDNLQAIAAEIFNDARRPWHVRPGSPAHDVIPAAVAGELPATCLGGRERLVGGKLDLGCYECQYKGLMIQVR